MSVVFIFIIFPICSSAIVILAIVCHVSSVEIRCQSRSRDWCLIRDNVPTVTDGDRITIANAQPVDTVKTLRWTWQTKMKSMPSVWFDTFPNLETVDLTGMGIEIITQTSLQNARKLKKLTLDKNNLRVIPEAVFKLAPNLVDLDLDNNKITELQGALTGLTKLKTLTLNNNHIKVWTRNMLAGAPQLETLHLSNNDIETIEDGAMALPMLKELHLNLNRIKTMPIDVLTGAPMLKHLDMTANMLTEIPMAMMHATKMTTLILDMNQLENVHLKQLLNMPWLEFVSLEDTGIVTDDMDKVTVSTTSTSMINHLDLTRNGIDKTDILKTLTKMPNLQTIILNENQLTSLMVDDIKTMLPSLSVISMEDMEIDCEWLKMALPMMTEMDIEMKTGVWDEDLSSNQQRKMVDNHLCGPLSED